MTQTARILLVDDEPFNLEILSEYLDDPAYQLILAENGMQAWQILQTDTQSFDLMILDRMMPGMNGIELLGKIKSDTRFTALPVIMQTADASKEQITEGLQRGAYYYLVKPYEREALLSIVNAALGEQRRQHALQDQLKQRDRAMLLLRNGVFTFRTLSEARALAAFLSTLCPQPEATLLGLAELMINAVEHGNLGISYQEKSRLNETGTWEEEVERRLHTPEYAQRAVQVCVLREPEKIRFVIEDQGDGFEPEKYLEMQPERAFDSHGRGIAMARMLSFSSVVYQGKGNIVVAEVAL